MIFKNRYFILTVSLIVLQQVALAFSTYFIAFAGSVLANEYYSEVPFYIVLFFSFALLAYFLSSCVAFFQLKLKNSLWKQYVFNLFSEFNHDQSLSGIENRKKTIAWLTGEAPAAFSEASEYSSEIVSIYCNVFFTLIVFGLTLGVKITALIGSSLLMSFFLVRILKNKIHAKADNMQSTKLSLFLNVSRFWDNHFFGNPILIKASITELNQRAAQYFKHTENYTILEQIVACFPIYFAVPLVMAMVCYEPHSYTVLGSFVALLPRTLQLLGNVHTLSLYNSRFLLVRKKLKNLLSFKDNLFRQDLLAQIDKSNLTITNADSNAATSFEDFYEKIPQAIAGRYLIIGKNGSGKSSLLKLLKGQFPEAILLSPEINLGQTVFAGSTGEQQIQKITEIFQQEAKVYLLDEWDANLDSKNRENIDGRINEIKSQSLVIEARHR